MEEKTDVNSQCSSKQSGEESCGDSYETSVPDDKNAAAVDGIQVSSQVDQDRSSANKVNKKVIKHALRQQAKRRRKNTTIAAGGGASTVPIHRITLSPHCELEEMTSDTSNYRQPTMAEVLSSIPGFHLRVPSRKRSNKKMSAAAQIEQTREGCVDLESPDSILVNTNLRQLLNRHTFASLPQLYQYKLLQLLPHVDRVPTQTETMYRLSSSALNNEFFARACLDWRERLAEGEFTPENQAKLKAEQEKEKSKLDPWKLKHFEPMWGESLREWPSLPPGSLGSGNTPMTAATPVPSTPTSGNKKEPLKGALPSSAKMPKDKPPQSVPVRTVGAVTRAVTSYREKKAAQESTSKVESVSPPAKWTKEIAVETSPDSTVQSTGDKKQDKPVESKKTLEPPVEEGFEERIEIVVESEQEVVMDASEVVMEASEDVLEGEALDSLKIDGSSVCESVQTDDSIVLEGEIVEEVVPVVEAVLHPTHDEPSSSSRKRRSSEILALSELPESDPTEPKRSRSAEKEEIVTIVTVEAPDAEESLVMEVRGDVIQLEMPDVLQEESSSSLVVDTQDVDSNVHSVDGVEEIVELDSPCIDGSAISPNAEESSSASPPPPPAVLEQMDLSTEPVVALPLESMELNRSLEAAVSSNQADLCAATDDPDYEVDKTLVDLVDLQEEVADRQSNQSVKAEALNKSAAHLEEWEIIKVDPNDVTSEVACSTASDSTVPTSVSSLPGLSAYGNVLYQEDEELKEDEAALLAAAWDVVGSSSEFQHQVNLNQPVSVIPCQEELEVRLQESSLPAPQWDYAPQDSKGQPQGHVKLELEVTLTPEVDSSTVTSTCGGNGTKLHMIGGQLGGGSGVSLSGSAQQLDAADPTKTSVADVTAGSGVATSYGVVSPKMTSTSPSPPGQLQSLRPQQQVQVVVCSNESQGVTVIPPTTIVCFPPPSVSNASTPHPPPHHHHHHRTTGASVAVQGPPTIAQSSSALPFIALTTSTPVRALVTKPVTKSSGRSGRNNTSSNRPPPGAVNLERSYQICQAVIQNSPNRHQLRCQLKPPPSLLAKTSVVNPAANRTVPGTGAAVAAAAAARGGGRVGLVQQPLGNAAAPTSRSHVVFRHVFASSAGGIPVNMAVLPSVHHQVSEVMRGLELRRSNSAPPHSAEATRGVRPPSAPPLPPPFASSATPANAGCGASNGSCSLKAMIACVMCGAFCHDDCLASPTSRLCIMCCDTR